MEHSLLFVLDVEVPPSVVLHIQVHALVPLCVPHHHIDLALSCGWHRTGCYFLDRLGVARPRRPLGQSGGLQFSTQVQSICLDGEVVFAVVLLQSVHFFEEASYFGAVVVGSEVRLACQLNFFDRQDEHFVVLGERREHPGDDLSNPAEEPVDCSE